MAFFPAGPKPTPKPQETYTLPNGVTVKMSMRKNQLTIAEKARQLKHDYKINFNPFLAKECGYSQKEIDEYFGPTKPYTIPPPAVKTMAPAQDEDEEGMLTGVE